MNTPRTLLGLWVAIVMSAPGVWAQSFVESDYTFLDEDVPGEVDVCAELHTAGRWEPSDVARVVFCYADDANCLFLQAAHSGMMLAEVRGGRQRVLATCPRWPEPKTPGVYRLTIKRRDWELRVLCEGEVLLTAYDDFAPGERIGAVGRGIKVEDLRAQPIGEMAFHDDFARTPEEGNPWHTLLGKWETRLPEARNRATDPAKAANPFSYMATGDRALATAGEAFWDSYEVRTAVKAAVEGGVGLAAYVQDSSNFYLLRAWAEAEGEGTVQLVKVREGIETVLAETPRQVPVGKWMELGLRVWSGQLSGLLDGQVVCQAWDASLGEGQIGLYTEKCAKALFDDVRLEPYRCYEESFAAGNNAPVEQVAGTWSLGREQLWGQPDATSLMAIGMTGSTQWRDYNLESDIVPWTATSVGLFCGSTGPADFYLFRWGPDQQNPQQEVQQLWRIADGQGCIIASRPAPLPRDRASHVRLTVDRGYLCVTVDGKRVLEAADTTGAGRGRVGYYVEGPGQSAAAFDNVRVTFCPEPAEPVSITEQFAKEDSMADWARPIASWRALGGRTYAYTLPVWGDFDLRVKLGHLVGMDGSVGLRVAPTADGLSAAGNLLTMRTEKGSRTVAVEVPPGQGVSGTRSTEEAEPMVVFRRRGDLVLALCDGKVFAWARGASGERNCTLGLKLGGVGINLNGAELTSPWIQDHAFSSAPTDWAPQNGTWDISDRWNCQPQWSWFCGRDAQTPLIWSKQTFGGDMVFEYWAAIMMDLAGGPGYSHPSDINGVICGDGKNLCSGYAFVFAGDNNTRTKIIRQGTTVAETAEVRFANPSTHGDLSEFHRHWFHCRVEKIGGHLTFYVDGRKALEYDDPNPLSGGHVGFWTHQNNGLLIARARISYRGQ